MATVVLSPSNVVGSPWVGGHFWVYIQWALGLRALGCEVVWLEEQRPSGDPSADAELRSLFHERLARHGLAESALLYAVGPDGPRAQGRPQRDLDALLRRADLLLNFHYAMDPALLARFRRSALVDIDPGLLQLWISTGQLRVGRHDRHFSIGETVGTPAARFPDCGFAWTRIRPPVWLPAWPVAFDASASAFTTVSSWWGGGGKGEWVTDGRDLCYENNKRATFLRFAALPRATGKALELALSLGEGDPVASQPEPAAEWRPERPVPDGVTDYVGDAEDVARLRAWGWLVRDAREAAGSPEAFQRYVQGSRGEFSCAKPSCMAFQNAWISDRTLCYLASGKPVVVQDTGPSAYLPHGLGMFRFRSQDDAAAALEAIDADYPKQCRAAREIAEAYFDARKVLPGLLDAALA